MQELIGASATDHRNGVYALSYFGEWLTATRIRRGLSGRKLAEKASISHATVSKIEDGLVGARPDMVRKLVDALGVHQEGAIKAWLKDQFPADLLVDDDAFDPLKEKIEELPADIRGVAIQQVNSILDALGSYTNKEERRILNTEELELLEPDFTSIRKVEPRKPGVPSRMNDPADNIVPAKKE